MVAIGSPAGVTGSSGYGAISYVVRSTKAVDGSTRIFYTDTAADSQAGTFLINTDGELIGWAVDDYGQEDHSSMTAVMSVSDYKGALELMSNGLPVPYFGILGQEITVAMAQKGMPKGIYISEAVMDSPAYNAGLQPGGYSHKAGRYAGDKSEGISGPGGKAPGRNEDHCKRTAQQWQRRIQGNPL